MRAYNTLPAGTTPRQRTLYPLFSTDFLTIKPHKKMTDKELVLRNIKKRYGIIGDCEGLNDALITAQKVAQSDFSVPIILNS